MSYPEEIKQQARELYAQGLNKSEIGRRLGVTQPTVRCWVDPEAAERDRESSRRWHQKNTERSNQRSRRWRQENLARKNELERLWRQKNPERCREKGAFRRAVERQATPPWLTKEHRKQMTGLHAKARRLEKRTGIPHHVDHIIPLRAKFDGAGKQIACGLHVPWNLQVLPGPENCSKHCRLPSPEHWTA